jgi:hypothetical protein
VNGFDVAPRTGVATDGQDVYVARLPDGPILRLGGTAAIVWDAAVSGPEASIADRVAATMGVEPASLQADVTAFVAALLAQGLIVSRDGARYWGDRTTEGGGT